MERKYGSNEEALAVAKEAIWLAWKACGGSVGMGVLQANDQAKKDEVWKRAYDQGDYAMRHGTPEEVNADYVFGRMMKLYFTVKGDTIKHRDNEPRGDYQSWCYVYKTYAALFDAAETSVLSQDNATAK